MIRRIFFRSLPMVLVGLAIASVAPSVAFASEAADTGLPRLRPGETLRYDEGLRVTFINVITDSRCPINARCVWAGDAKVALRIKVGNRPATTEILHTYLKPRALVIPANVFPPGMVGIPKSYVISIDALNPLPFAGRETKPEDYRLKLNIRVAQ